MKTTILATTTTKNRTEPKFKSVLGIAGQLLTWASMNRPPWQRGLFLIALIFACFALAPQARAVCQEGCLTNFNTALGVDALVDNTTGSDNTAIGFMTLSSNTTGHHNTANGFVALSSNTTGYGNTANGSGTLSDNTTGYYNTANGTGALNSNTTGNNNTANGAGALSFNTTGDANTATGAGALEYNTTGHANTAAGDGTLYFNTTGNDNTANGKDALWVNFTGDANTANGCRALYHNTFGNYNTANGRGALFSNTTGSSNVGIGVNAGCSLTTGSGNVCIGVNVYGVAGESNTTRIRNVFSSMASGRAVYVNSNNKIGTLFSSRRFKEEIEPMDKASEALFALKPVTFRYKKEVDPARALSFGLIAEDVAEISPELITRDEKGDPQTVRYDAVNAMLLNEFLKEHKKVEEQQATIAELKSTVAEQRKDFEAISAQQHKEIQALMASLKEQAWQIQKVSAHIEMGKFATGRIRRGGHAPQMVLNNR